ncbi:Holliday junction DNA helicase RuvA [hydrothermal vent metagenome]|uniref:Holliday junction DNA helicase RuvA n=1 Tax=hydrothermal vent metagenome TaxID=652676 RepID=A0A1W1EKL4_9ZZZZ
MIVGIEGKIELKEATRLHINVNGLIYEVFISINSSNVIDSDIIKLFTTQIIREDSSTLFGFISNDEKRMFDILIKINGVGAKVALAICSTFSPDIFSRIISDKDVTMLKKVPGIGPKSASRILVELADFIVTGDDLMSNKSMVEAVMGLESLGFKKEHIEKALKGVTGDTPSLIKEGLKKLQRL